MSKVWAGCPNISFVYHIAVAVPEKDRVAVQQSLVPRPQTLTLQYHLGYNRIYSNNVEWWLGNYETFFYNLYISGFTNQDDRWGVQYTSQIFSVDLKNVG